MDSAIVAGNPTAPTVTTVIPEANLAVLRARLYKLNKRAWKLTVAPVTLVVGPAEPKVHPASDEHPYGLVVPRVTVTVTGETPKLAGWRLAAVIDLSLEEPLFNRVPGETANLDAYKARAASYLTGAADCEHCKTIRVRHETFVLVNDDGRVTQVGRNCLVDFLGGVDPKSLVTQAAILAEWTEAVEDAEREHSLGGGGGEPAIDIRRFLAMTVAVIERWGWLSKPKARELEEQGEFGRAPNVGEVWCNLFPPRNQTERDKERLVRPTEAHVARAAEVLGWARDLDPEDPTEYLRNLGRACRSEFVTHKHGGLVASAVASWGRAVEREIRAKRFAESAAASEFVGEPGKRLKWTAATRRKPATEGLTLTLIGAKSLEGQWGASHLHKLVDARGNHFTWFGSTPAGVWEDGGNRYRRVEIGETFRADATVKRHETYHGVNQTTLTRVVVREMVGDATVEEGA